MDALVIDLIRDVPKGTLLWATAIVGTSLAEYAGIVAEYQLVFNLRRATAEREYWRFFSSFFYLGKLKLDLILQMWVLMQYSRQVEEEAYRGRPRDFWWTLVLLGSFIVAGVSALMGSESHLLSNYLSQALIYLWARRNPHLEVSIMGLFTMRTAYLPWAMALVNKILRDTSLLSCILGIFAGHLVFFAQDIYPRLHHGRKIFSPPWEWFERQDQDHN
uniref:Derlin n=1 Tax=Blastobotrys adeninivorans TaxID=409370 RepID=A0A060T8Q0_BLAAD